MDIQTAPKLLASRVIPDANLNMEDFFVMEPRTQWRLIPSEDIRHSANTQIVSDSSPPYFESVKIITIPAYYIPSTIDIIVRAWSDVVSGGGASASLSLYVDDVISGSSISLINRSTPTDYMWSDIAVTGGTVLKVGVRGFYAQRSYADNFQIMAIDTKEAGLIKFGAAW